ncbi:MAG: HD domain-containing protein [Eubacterium sp.]|nr:HD domain-containing protein [Candidatus Colimonas fimequi]
MKRSKGEQVVNIINRLIDWMITYDCGDTKRIQHLIKVHALCKYIGELEGIDAGTLGTLEMAAILHDIGIKESETQFGNCNGSNQERLGPPIAMTLFDELAEEGYVISQTTIDRICYLIAHHHTYDNIDGLDYRILVEADFLVNMWENKYAPEAIHGAYENIFVTHTGRSICRRMFGLED